MTTFAVIREAGCAWVNGQGIEGQPAVAEHTAFMEALAGEGILLLGGPLAGTETGRLRALLVVNAESEAEIHRLLADDPWMSTEQLRTVTIEAWKVLVGAGWPSSASSGGR